MPFKILKSSAAKKPSAKKTSGTKYHQTGVKGIGGTTKLKRHRASIRVAKPLVNVEDKTFDEIRDECRRRRILFEDPEFPANNESLFFSQQSRTKLEWKRPKDIVADPRLFVGGASRFDIKQGELGDCWLLAAIASLSLNNELLHRIIPDDQGFDDGQYAGIFHFQFWQYGEWIDVVIDDLLPTWNGRLVYLHSAETNEFWSALLEKAYAKLNGSYEALRGGSASEAMEDFTGGVTEIYELKDAPNNLYHLMEKSLRRGSLMGCAIETQNSSQRESKLPNGLLRGHAYSVTGLESLHTGEKLVRVRNPWGQVEWNGAWSDDSPKWDKVPEEKRRLAVEFGDDGEFWMSFSDFSRCFTKLEICNLGPDALEDDSDSSQWVTSIHEGRWIRGCTAGGCRNYPDTFWINPQFRLRLEEEDDDPDDDEIGCSFIVSLMQKNRRKQKSKGQGLLTIGFALYKLKEEVPHDQPVKKDYFLYNQSTARSKQFINLRENSQRFKLPAGEYVIVPSTFQPNEEADFVLRLYTEKRSDVNELDEETKQIKATQDDADDKPATAPAPAQVDSAENDKRFRSLFNQLTGEDGEIDAFELQEIVNSVLKKNRPNEKSFSGFGLEACRSMVALMDVTNSGMLNYEEFKALWVRVRKWINIFKKFDADNSGNFDLYELRDALANAAAYNEYKNSRGDTATISMNDWLSTTMYS